MRIMDDVINDYGLEEELENRLEEETGNSNFWLGEDTDQGGMDEDSDKEDPEAVLRQEAADKKAFLEGAKMILDARTVVLDLERTRMQLEDFRSQALK